MGGSKGKQKPLKFLNIEPREVDGIWQMQDFGDIQVSISLWAYYAVANLAVQLQHELIGSLRM